MIRRRPRSKKKEPLRFVATCGAGLENLVREEVVSFGGREVTSTPGAVHWQAPTLESAYRACLWSRFASRILFQLARFEAPDPDALYREVGKIDWSDHFSARTTFAVYTTLVRSGLSHSHYASLRIKDAIVDQFRSRTGKRPDIDVRRPGIRINLHVDGTAATLALDLSGDSLHRRGYRAGAGTAPLKESLAAAIVHLAGIGPELEPDTAILDPMCGSGTLLIEAALILGDSAPGLQRENFGFMHWQRHSAKLWDRLVAEALEREDQRAEAPWPMLIGYDADPGVVAVARKNIINAGLNDRIIVKQRQIAKIKTPTARGILVTNPPYGERLSEKEAVKYLYRCMGRVVKSGFAGWQMGFFTANPDLADMLGLPWQERYRLYNGPIKCRLLKTVVPALTEAPVREWRPAEVKADGAAVDFANRLYKNCQQLLPWAREKNITCLRIYDADMPEYNLSVDLYGHRVLVREYPAPATVDTDRAENRFNDALQAIRSLLDVPHSDIFIHTARKKTEQKKDGRQNRDRTNREKKKSPHLFEVCEGEWCFLVDLSGSGDTGLFPDQRGIRSLVAELGQARTFLNLFGHTGCSTVAAALGGAVSTTTVEKAEHALTRARVNLSLNGYGGPLHRFAAQDPMVWLKSCRERFGLIHVHLPVFRKSLYSKLIIDVEKDHARLLELAIQALAREGTLLFSLNAGSFQLDPDLATRFAVTEISDQVRARDFQRARNPLRCWQIRHHPAEELES